MLINNHLDDIDSFSKFMDKLTFIPITVGKTDQTTLYIESGEDWHPLAEITSFSLSKESNV